MFFLGVYEPVGTCLIILVSDMDDVSESGY